jgi:uncharacterized phage protein (TIGR01671 family)
MNREIKFRAWDKIDKIMREVTCYNLYDEYVRLDEDNSGNSITRKIDDVILMQYTGLKDKNGKEIYEGDIVRSGKEFNTYTGLNSKIYGGKIYEVKNNGWKFYLSPGSIYEVDRSDLEIIGNIHENPEILKELIN